MAIPKKKKRRDKYGISVLKKDAEEKSKSLDKNKSVDEGKWNSIKNKVLNTSLYDDTDNTDVDLKTQVNPNGLDKTIDKIGNIGHKIANKFKNNKTNIEEETSASSAGGDAGYVGYAGPAAWSSKGDLIKGTKSSGNKNVGGGSSAGVMRKPMWPGGTLIQENCDNYLINPEGFIKFYDNLLLEEERSKLDNKLINDTNAFTSYTVKHWDKPDANLEDETVNTGKLDNAPRQNELDEKAKSKSQQQLFGIARAIQTGKVKPEDASKEANKIAKTVSKADVLDFSKTKTEKLPEKIDEDTNQSMISDNPTSMTNDTTQTMANTIDNPESPVNGIERGSTTVDSSEINENELFENIEKELIAFSKHQSNLNKMMEERKSNSQIINDRVTAQNPKNFKSDMKNSGTEDTIKLDNFLQTKDDITEVGDNAHKFSEELEKNELSKTNGEAFKNVGNSGNEKGNEIPKRNMTTEEQHEVDLYKEGLGDYIYENPSEQFEKRMETDMGERDYKLRQDRLKARENREMYHKVSVPVTNKKETEPKYEENLKESLITGRYKDSLGKSHIIDFIFKDVSLSESVDESWSQIHFDGMGNSYANKLNQNSSKLEINEAIVRVLDCNKYYINDNKQLFAVENKKVMLSETNEKNLIQESEETKRMKKLLNYKPSTYINNKLNKVN